MQRLKKALLFACLPSSKASSPVAMQADPSHLPPTLLHNRPAIAEPIQLPLNPPPSEVSQLPLRQVDNRPAMQAEPSQLPKSDPPSSQLDCISEELSLTPVVRSAAFDVLQEADNILHRMTVLQECQIAERGFCSSRAESPREVNP